MSRKLHQLFFQGFSRFFLIQADLKTRVSLASILMLMSSYLAVAAETGLFSAIQIGNLEAVQKVIEKNSELINYQFFEDGNTPLTLAVEKSQLRVVKYLIQKGADLDLPRSDGRRAIELISRDQNELIFNYLWEAKEPCPICQESVKAGSKDPFEVPCCEKKFHLSCLSKMKGFQAGQASCPLCREKIHPPLGLASLIQSGPSDTRQTTKFTFRELLEFRRNMTLDQLFGGFVRIPAGTFQMGSPESELSRKDDELRHIVYLDEFYLQSFPVSQWTYLMMMNTNPSQFKRPENCPGSHFRFEVSPGIWESVCAALPVEQVSWYQAQAFISRINLRFENQGIQFRLPTEAEQEYAFRGDTHTAFVSGTNEESLGNYVAYALNSTLQTQPLGLKLPNSYRVYRGGVWEWGGDWYAKDYVDPLNHWLNRTSMNPQGPSFGQVRVLRGCSWFSNRDQCRSAYRSKAYPNYVSDQVGFRVVRSFRR